MELSPELQGPLSNDLEQIKSKYIKAIRGKYELLKAKLICLLESEDVSFYVSSLIDLGSFEQVLDSVFDEFIEEKILLHYLMCINNEKKSDCLFIKSEGKLRINFQVMDSVIIGLIQKVISFIDLLLPNTITESPALLHEINEFGIIGKYYQPPTEKNDNEETEDSCRLMTHQNTLHETTKLSSAIKLLKSMIYLDAIKIYSEQKRSESSSIDLATKRIIDKYFDLANLKKRFNKLKNERYGGDLKLFSRECMTIYTSSI